MKTSQIAAIIAIILFSPLTCAGQAYAADIFAVGGWSAAAQIIGTDIVSTYESATDATLLSITGTLNWTVSVRRTGQDWPSDLVLSLRRTGNGSGGSGGSGGLSGGTAYQAITLTDSYFFQGARSRFNVPIQMRISGISIGTPAGTHSTTLTYTVVDY